MLSQLFKPENIQDSNYRYYFANNYALLIGGFAHLWFIPIFYYLNLTTLMLYNFLSVFIFASSFILNRKGFHTICTFPASIEIMLHAYLAIYFIGWESGFFYYLLAIVPMILPSPIISKLQKIVITIFITGFFLYLKYFANTHSPIIFLEQNVINTLYYMNSSFLIIGISLIVYYFSLASDISENKIHKERHDADLANQAKSIFLANMSHELRTPLNAIIGYGEMLKDDADELGHEQNAKDLSKITSAGNHLLILINSILDLTKIEAGKTEIEYQMVNIRSLINDVVSTIDPLVAKRNNTLVINCADNPAEASIDQTRIKQILFNLLSNACKFTENGTIELNIYYKNHHNKIWLCFTIKDTGIGIAKDKIELLYKPFVQADISTTRLYGGTGLGLTISKHFVTLMDGSIDVKSTVGKGTTFTVKLPIRDKI